MEGCGELSREDVEPDACRVPCLQELAKAVDEGFEGMAQHMEQTLVELTQMSTAGVGAGQCLKLHVSRDCITVCGKIHSPQCARASASESTTRQPDYDAQPTASEGDYVLQGGGPA